MKYTRQNAIAVVLFTLTSLISCSKSNETRHRDVPTNDFGDQNHTRSNKAWRPELPIKEGETAWDSVMRELDRSLNEFSEHLIFEDFVACEKHFVLLINNRIFVSPNYENLGKRKPSDHLIMIYSILQRRQISSAVYVFDSGARGNGYDNCDNGHRLPMFLISKKFGFNMPGLLFPNPFFGNVTNWDIERSLYDEYSDRNAFKKRKARALWRGSIECFKNCAKDMGIWQRWGALVQSWKHPDLLDAKATPKHNEALSIRNVSHIDCEPSGLVVYPDMVAAYKELQKFPSAFQDSHLDHHKYVEYQFLLNLAGSQGGGYSRNLNHIWSLGSVVVLWDAHFTEWYFPALHDGETHITGDYNNVIDTLKSVRRDPVMVEKLRTNARQIFETFISGEGLSNYVAAAFKKLREKFHNVTKVLDDHLELNGHLKQLGCGSKFHLLEVSIFDSRKGAVLNQHSITSDDPDIPACAVQDDTAKEKLLETLRTGQQALKSFSVKSWSLYLNGEKYDMIKMIKMLKHTPAAANNGDTADRRRYLLTDSSGPACIVAPSVKRKEKKRETNTRSSKDER